MCTSSNRTKFFPGSAKSTTSLSSNRPSLVSTRNKNWIQLNSISTNLLVILILCISFFPSSETEQLGFCSAPSDEGDQQSLDPKCTVTESNSKKMGEVGIERERTFIMIKPDGVQRGLVGAIIKRFEQKGFKLVGLKFQWADAALLNKHYAEHVERPFFPGLVKYMSSGPVVPMVWEGLNVVKTGRQMLGETNPSNSLPGTIRGDFAILTGRNVVHGSDSVESANREISLWFTGDEQVKWKANEEPWLYE